MTDEPDGIPSEIDYATGDRGDLGVWGGDHGTRPLDVWDGERAIKAYFSDAHLGSEFDVGDEFYIRFTDRVLGVTVNSVEVGNVEEGDA